MRIGIVGGGPAGLVAAIAARQAGFAATVFEQASSFERIGGAVGIQSNGLRVLGAIGILNDFRPLIEFTHRAGLEAPPGRRVTYADFRELDIPHAGFAVALRYDLQLLLVEAARMHGADIRMQHRCTGTKHNGERVTLTFSNGNTETFDLILACDGILSAVRESSSAFRVRLKTIGEAYLRAVAQLEHPDRGRIGEFWAADGRRVGAFPLPHGRTYVFCSVPLGEWKDILENRLEPWIESWNDFGPIVSRLMRAVDWSRAVYDELSDLRVDRWFAERIVLLGDAAHAMTPNLGQGANSAMVDALVFINLLTESAGRGGWKQAAIRYQQLRKPFVTRLQDSALMGGRIAAWQARPARALRDTLMRAGTRIGPARRASMKLTAGFNPAEDPYIHRPVPSPIPR